MKKFSCPQTNTRVHAHVLEASPAPLRMLAYVGREAAWLIVPIETVPRLTDHGECYRRARITAAVHDSGSNRMRCARSSYGMTLCRDAR
jgi:hypothetical protein